MRLWLSGARRREHLILTSSAFIRLAALTAFGAASMFAAGSGLRGDYFNNTGLVGSSTLARVDATVDFDWASNAPGTGVSTNYFSVRWMGQVEAPATGSYTFVTLSDNGVRLWVNNTLVVDSWTSYSLKRDASAPVSLTAGQKYSLRMEYFEGTGTAVAKLMWITPGLTAEVTIPSANLYPVTQSGSGTPLPIPLPPYYLSSMTPASPINGFGPYSKDRSNGDVNAGDGAVITIGGISFSKGLGVHAISELKYPLNDRFDYFHTSIGVDDEVGDGGSVIFQAFLDDTKAYESPVMRGTDPLRTLALRVTGKKELMLRVLDAGDGITMDHAD